MNFGLAAAQNTAWLSTVLPFVLMFVVFYFLLIRPQQKRTKKRNAMLAALKKNDKIVTIGGINGTVTDLTDDKVTIRVNESTKLTFERSAVNVVVSED